MFAMQFLMNKLKSGALSTTTSAPISNRNWPPFVEGSFLWVFIITEVTSWTHHTFGFFLDRSGTVYACLRRDSTVSDVNFPNLFGDLCMMQRIGTIRIGVLRNLSFISEHTLGLQITQALASKSGPSVKSCVNTLEPRMVVMMLTIAFRDQLTRKAAIDMESCVRLWFRIFFC